MQCEEPRQAEEKEARDENLETLRKDGWEQIDWLLEGEKGMYLFAKGDNREACNANTGEIECEYNIREIKPAINQSQDQ